MAPIKPRHHLVFDFDGTIADTITFGFSRLNEYTKELGSPPLTQDEMEALRSRSYQEIIAEYKIPLWKIPRLLLRLRNEIRAEIDTIDPFPGIPKMLTSLQHHGYRMSVLTSNDRSLVEQFLHNHQITEFDDIYSEKNLFRKAQAIRRFIHLKGLKPDQIIYIGDEVRDIEACHHAKVPIVSVSWGFNTGPLLQQHRPIAVVHTPLELEQKLTSLSETSRLVRVDKSTS